MEITPPLGPEPIGPRPAPGPPIPPARQRLATLLAGRSGGATIGELVHEVGGHANTVRFHLEALVSAGHASRSPRATEGRGRPSMAYRLTPAGAAALAGDEDVLAAEYLGLATAFATHLAERDDHPQEESRAVGRVWGRQLAESSGDADTGGGAVPPGDETSLPGAEGPTPRQRVVALLARLGFSPEVDPPTGTGVQRVSLLTCPLLSAAKEHPDVICSVHEGLVSGALASFGAPDDTALIIPFARPGACHVMLGERVPETR